MPLPPTRPTAARHSSSSPSPVRSLPSRSPALPPTCGATTLRRKHTKPSSSSPWHAPAAACPHGRSCRNKRAASSFKQVAIPRPRKSASSASCWPCRPRAGPRPGSGGTAERHCSTWPRAPPRCAARCSTCCPSRTARATSTAGGWTCWMRPARWTRSSCRPSGCRGSRRRWWRRRPPPAQLFELIGRMAPRLRADDRPLILTPRRWGHTFDANLIDVIVEHDIPVCDPPPHARIDLLEWLQSGSDGGVRRSLEHMAADRRYQPLLSAAVPSFCDYAERSVDDLLVSPGLEQLLRRWFQERASAVDRGGLIQAARSLSELAGAAGPRTLA